MTSAVFSPSGLGCSGREVFRIQFQPFCKRFLRKWGLFPTVAYRGADDLPVQ